MAFTQYGTRELVGLLDRARAQKMTRPDGFWLRLFNRTIVSDKEDIQFDVINGDDRRLAPFVMPHVQGKIMAEKGFEARVFRPAYVKPKHIIDPSKAIPRMAGEGLLGEMSLEARFNAHVAAAILSQDEMIGRREDWLAAKAIQFGAVTITGENYPTKTVSFQRHASLTYTLSGTARWGESAADPLGDIATARKNAFARGNAPITDVVFGLDAWTKFLADQDVQNLLDTNFRGTQSDFNRTTAVMAGDPFEYQGQISGFAGGGQLRLWTYSNVFKDEDMVEAQFLDPNHVCGFGEAIQAFRLYGAIMDKGAALRPLARFPKMWDQEDPSATYVMTQSAPLMVPMEPNNTFLIRTYG
jgi:hypothetical protein